MQGERVRFCVRDDGPGVPESVRPRLFQPFAQEAAPGVPSSGLGLHITRELIERMGGSIGYGLPVAIGAALAAPGRKVVALEGDGSAMYTPQALWTMARERLDVTVLVFANRAYQILRGEFAGVQAGAMGPRASGMLSLEQPALDWCALARGMGVEGIAVRDTAALHHAMLAANAQRGPFLIEVVL